MSLYGETETVWLDANRFYDAERQYYEVSIGNQEKSNPGHHSTEGMTQLASSIANEIANVRQKIHGFLKAPSPELDCRSRLDKIESEMKIQKQEVEQLSSRLKSALSEISVMKDMICKLNIQSKDLNQVTSKESENMHNGSSAAVDDDDVDLFGSDEETEDEKKLKEERVKAYADKKAKKPGLVAKSSVVLDVKPWDDETDMKAMEKAVRAISSDGLVWGASKLVPLAYGIHKLQILAIVEDEKVSISWLQDTIQEMEDLVQSVDIAAFNKL